MKEREVKVEDVFGDVLNKDSISQEQITEPNKFLAEIVSVLVFV